MNGPVQQGFAEAFRDLRDAFGVPITFGNMPEISALVAESQISRDLGAGGFQAEAEFVARVLLSDLPTVPVNGMPVSYKGKGYKVAKEGVQEGHPIGEFTLIPR